MDYYTWLEKATKIKRMPEGTKFFYVSGTRMIRIYHPDEEEHNAYAAEYGQSNTWTSYSACAVGEIVKKP